MYECLNLTPLVFYPFLLLYVLHRCGSGRGGVVAIDYNLVGVRDIKYDYSLIECSNLSSWVVSLSILTCKRIYCWTYPNNNLINQGYYFGKGVFSFFYMFMSNMFFVMYISLV